MKLADFSTSRELKAIRPLLEAWIKSVKRYCTLNEGDNPWWYNERASLSTLAAAAWMLSGWSALEEFNTRKRGGMIPKKKVGDGTRHGRCDLYIAGHRHDFAFEAKQAWHSLGAKKNIARQAMAQAWEDAGRLDIHEGDYRLAATFVVPHVAKRHAKDKNHLKLVKDWLASEPFATNRPGCARAIAWVFFKKSYISDRNGRAFPGVVLVIERRQRGSRRKPG